MQNVLVNSVVEKKAKNNRTFWQLDTEEGPMFVWDKALREKIVAGRSHELETEGDEFVKVIDVGAVSVHREAPREPGQAPVDKFYPRADPAKTREDIARAVALKEARAAYSTIPDDYDGTVWFNKVLDMAAVFERWLLRPTKITQPEGE